MIHLTNLNSVKKVNSMFGDTMGDDEVEMAKFSDTDSDEDCSKVKGDNGSVEDHDFEMEAGTINVGYNS